MTFLRGNRRWGVCVLGALLLLSTGGLGAGAGLVWESITPIPDRNGLAGAFAGVSDGVLLVAGGANFPEGKPWEGGKKVWHDTVFALEKPDGQWQAIGRIPRPLAYGVCVSTPRGVVCVGGSDAERHFAEAFVLRVSNGMVQTRCLPSLPFPVAYAAGVVLGETVYVCGGSDQPGERSALNRLLALDLSAATSEWKDHEPCPGRPRILSVAAVLDGMVYLIGGVALDLGNGQAKRVYLRDGWRYQPGHGWRQIADLPAPSAAAPSPAPVLGSQLFILGGDDGSLVGFQPVERHPGFPRVVWCYDTVRNQWSHAGEAVASRATLPTVWWLDRFVLPSGEMRPGVRSPEVWTVRLGR